MDHQLMITVLHDIIGGLLQSIRLGIWQVCFPSHTGAKTKSLRLNIVLEFMEDFFLLDPTPV